PENGSIASVTIAGSLIGGRGDDSGEIQSNHDLGPVKIGHDLVGGSITDSATANLVNSGVITGSPIASITLRGSIVSGIDASSSHLLINNALVAASDDLGSLTVKGSLIGHPNTGSDFPTFVTVLARGQNAITGNLTATSDVAIGKISIGGNVQFA